MLDTRLTYRNSIIVRRSFYENGEKKNTNSSRFRLHLAGLELRDVASIPSNADISKSMNNEQ